MPDSLPKTRNTARVAIGARTSQLALMLQRPGRDERVTVFGVAVAGRRWHGVRSPGSIGLPIHPPHFALLALFGYTFSADKQTGPPLRPFRRGTSRSSISQPRGGVLCRDLTETITGRVRNRNLLSEDTQSLAALTGQAPQFVGRNQRARTRLVDHVAPCIRFETKCLAPATDSRTSNRH
jgi:hypothetical protein